MNTNKNMEKAIALTVKYTNNDERLQCAYMSTENVSVGSIVKLDTGDYAIVEKIYTTNQTFADEAYNLDDKRAA